MASLIGKVISFVKNRSVRNLYLRWVFAKIIGREPFVPLPGGARGYSTGKFNDFYGIAVQHPAAAEFNTFSLLLGDGGVFVDVGANMGLTTVVAAKTGRAERIIAFEPTHSYAIAWHKNILANNVRNACLFQCAIGEKAGVAEFVVNPNAPLHNRLNLGRTFKRYQPSVKDATYLGIVSVATLDDLCGDLGIAEIRLLKIDVEGAEPSVLRGATNLLSRRAIKALYVEFVPEFMREMNEDVGSYSEWIYSCGYTAFRIQQDGSLGSAMSVAELTLRQFSGLNVVFLH
jgi:FkbM family methyltransferase